jgi:hypothetical protein
MAQKTQSQDTQDSPWKRILQQYLPQAIEFFFPDIAKMVDWSVAPEFLDKEFVKIAPDAKVGKRFADQLVRLKLKRGKELVLLVHVEIQAAAEKDFAERMFIYAIRIFDYFRQPAVSVAILCDASPTWRPAAYSFNLPYTHLNFEFGTVKLVDYRNQMAELDASTNPFAMVVKAHLKMQETKRDKPSRKVWKMRLVREIHESGYNQEEVVNLFNFMDWVLGLPRNLEEEFWAELKAYEEERKMPYITSVERIGYERGRVEGQQSLVSLQVQQKIGQIPTLLNDRISALSPDQLEALAIALLNFNSIDDLNHWLEANG